MRELLIDCKTGKGTTRNLTAAELATRVQMAEDQAKLPPPVDQIEALRQRIGKLEANLAALTSVHS